MLAVLRAGRLSRNLLLIRAVLDMVTRRGISVGSELEAAYDLLATADARSPEAVRDVLSYPSVGVWAAGCLRTLRAEPTLTPRLATDLRHFTAIVAAAAIRTGVPFELTVPVRAGTVALPTLGVALLPSVGEPDTDSVATIRGGLEAVSVIGSASCVAIPVDPTMDAAGWQGLRRLTAEAGSAALDVPLDDIDPFRAGPGFDLAGRLHDETFLVWQSAFSQAWNLLIGEQPRYAAELASILTAVVPMLSSGRVPLSMTFTDAFGSVALTLPSSAALLARTLIHELQHAKLEGLLGLCPLLRDQDDDGPSPITMYAPWRSEPRPARSLLQGVYAHLGVTAFWRVRRRNAPPGPTTDVAHVEFGMWRDETRRAIAQLRSHHVLAEIGERFVAGMDATLERWQDDPVPAPLDRYAEEMALDRRLLWRLRHVPPAPSRVEELARAWLEAHGPAAVDSLDQPAEEEPPAEEEAPAEEELRRALRMLHIADPARLRDLVCDRTRAASGTALEKEADLTYVAGDPATAARIYRRVLTWRPDAGSAWAGLALAWRQTGPGRLAEGMLAEPELVRAVSLRVRELSGSAPDPQRLVSWLTGPTNAPLGSC